MADFVRPLIGQLRQSGTHHANKVRFYLEVDVIGMEVIVRVSGHRRENAVVIVLARLGIGMPELIPRVGEKLLKHFGVGIPAFSVHHIHQGHLHIEVVLPFGILYLFRFPRYGVLYDFS